MPLFVDHAGMNTLIHDELDLNNSTRTLNKRETIVVDLAVKSTNESDSRFIESSTSSNLLGGSGNLTFSFWINLDNKPSAPDRVIFNSKTSTSDSVTLKFKGTTFQIIINDFAGTSKTWNYTSITPASLTNSWNHIYVVWTDNFSNNPEVYLNGDYVAHNTTAGSGTANGRKPVTSYSFYDDVDAGQPLLGSLQSFGIWRVSSSGNPAILYNNGEPLNSGLPDESDLKAFYLFGNESDENTINLDYTGEIGQDVSGITLKPTSGSITGDRIVSIGGHETSQGVIHNIILDETTGSFVGRVGFSKQLAAINAHRNGPYGYSTWKQLRVSENPITRYHKANSTMTFVIQPGPVRNVLSGGELRVRDRYSALYTFTEPAIAQKSYPLVWNVGRHFKDEDGNIDLENPERFSIISSYANQGIGFANNEVDKLHKFDPDEEKTEYREIYKLYAEGGLNNQASPLTHWEFLQYRETVFPHMKNQFQNENLERPNFVSFYRHNRENRRVIMSPSEAQINFGVPADNINLTKSSWPLDEAEDFLTSTKDGDANTSYVTGSSAGILLHKTSKFSNILQAAADYLTSSNPFTVSTGISALDSYLSPFPVYSRCISLKNTASISNPSGMLIPQTGGLSENILFEGGALWEAGSTRQIKDADGNYVSTPKTPFYDTYEAYIEEARRKYKNFSVVPEFRMSTQVEDYLTNNNAIKLDMFDVTGGVENAQNSSQSQFYEIYSNSDFMRQFELLNEDHKEFTNGKVLSLRCKAVKKFLPYEGFYPAQRTVDLAKRFYDSFKNNISLYNTNGVQLNDFNFGRQMVMAPLFAPGVLFNTIKSGIAVDYPIITGSMDGRLLSRDSNSEYLIFQSNFDKRIPFEALIEPHDHLAGFSLTSNEPHPSGNLSASAKWDGQGDELYSKMANNFLAEVPEFFLPNGQLTSIVSKKQKDITLVSGSVYGMRVKMRRAMDGGRGSVYHSGSAEESYYPPQDVNSGSVNVRESFTMYSRPSAFGPPTHGANGFTIINEFGHSSTSVFSFDADNEYVSGSTGSVGTTLGLTLKKDSGDGFNYPFTPPYYHGEGWCEIVITASSDNMTISEIQSTAEYTYTRFDYSFYRAISGSTNISFDAADRTGGPQAFQNLNRNAVQLSASLNLQGIGKVGKGGGGLGGAGGNLVVDSAVDEDSRWIIQTKFETPMFNFNHISEEGGTLSVPVYGSESVPRGMWHQYGRIPEENEGVFLEVGPIEENWWRKARGETGSLKDLSAALGFSGQSTKIGRLRSSKKIYEAVVAVPFIESEGRKKFFRLNAAEVEDYKKGGEDRIALTSGDPQAQVGRSVLNQMQKMEKYIFPPSFDFLNYEEVDPIAMYIFEFSHTLSQQDLADIWQNLPPDIGTEMEESEVAITHPLLKKELLGEGGLQSGNTLIDMPNKLKWMVFKVKQRAASNYFKKTVLRNPEVNTDVDSGNVTVDEFGATSNIQYNWPYDFFSLVELVKIDSEVEFEALNASVNAGELAVMRDRAAQGQAVVPQGVDFSSINNFIASVPANAILQAGIPMDEYAAGMISLNSLVSQYNAASLQYGVNSQQAQALNIQIAQLNPAILATPLASNMLAQNNINIGFNYQ
jgi:hypothetical protein